MTSFNPGKDAKQRARSIEREKSKNKEDKKNKTFLGNKGGKRAYRTEVGWAHANRYPGWKKDWKNGTGIFDPDQPF